MKCKTAVQKNYPAKSSALNKKRTAMKWTNASVRFGTQMKTLCGPYGLQSQQQSDMKGAFCGSQWFTFLSRLNFSWFFFVCVGLTKKSLAADKSKITHSNRRLPNIVRMDKYTANTFLKRKGENGKNLAVSTQSCPYTVHYGDMSLFFFFSLYWFPVQSNAMQRNANWPSVLCCVFVKKENVWTVWTKSHDPVCVLVLGVTHASMTSAKL